MINSYNDDDRITITAGKIEFGKTILKQLDDAILELKKDKTTVGVSKAQGYLTCYKEMLYNAECIPASDVKKIEYLIDSMNFNNVGEIIYKIYDGVRRRIEYFEDPYKLDDKDKLSMAGMTLEGFDQLQADMERSVVFIESKYPCKVDIVKMEFTDKGYSIALDILPKVE